MKVAVSIALAGLLLALPITQVMAQDAEQEEEQEEEQVLPVLQPSELCSDQPDAAIATVEDANLEATIRAAISVSAQDDLTCALVSELTDLNARNAGIESLVGMQNLTSLTHLRLPRDSITDISVLSGLTSLTYVPLNSNRGLSNIQPLLNNTGLGAGDRVVLRLTSVSCSDVTALQAKGVSVFSACS